MPSVKRSLGLGCAGVLLVLLLLVGLVVGFSRSLEHSTWPKRLPEVRLEPRLPHLTESAVTPDNGYFYLRQLTNGVAWTESDAFQACGWREEGYPELDTAVEALAEVFELCRRAARAPHFQVATMDSVDAVIPYIGDVVKQTRARCYQAERAAGQQRWDEAAIWFEEGLLLAGGTSRGGPLINHLVSIACTEKLLVSMRRCAERGQPPAAWTRRMQEALARSEREQEPFSEAIRYEHLFARSALNLVYDNPAELGELTGESLVLGPAAWRGMLSTLALLGSTPKKTGAHFAAVYSHLVAATEKPYQPNGMALEVQAFLHENPRSREMLNDPVGRILMALILPALDSATTRSILQRQNLSATRVVLALHGRGHRGAGLPDDLSDLVPDELDAVPADLFDPGGGRLRYHKNNGRWLLYSVGPNQTDDQAAFNWLNEKERSLHENRLDLVFHADEAARRCARFRENEQSAPASVEK